MMTRLMQSQLFHLVREIVAVGRIFGGEDSEAVAFDRLAVLASHAIPNCHAASVVLVERTGPRVVAGSDPSLASLADKDFAGGRGPVAEVLAFAEPRLVADPATETRWDGLAHYGDRADVRSLLYLPLLAQEGVQGVLVLASAKPNSFREAGADLAALLAAQATTMALNLGLYSASRRMVANLNQALTTRAVIDQAKGVLMERHGYDADQAFGWLSQEAQRTNVKLHDVARRLVREVTTRGESAAAGR